nr:hypothetical protein [Dysgonomonas sp. 25]
MMDGVYLIASFLIHQFRWAYVPYLNPVIFILFTQIIDRGEREINIKRSKYYEDGGNDYKSFIGG